MGHPGDSGGNMAHQSNPSGYFMPSFPAPATFGAQASHQALFQENQRDHSNADTLLMPPAMAPQTFHFQPESQPHMTMPHQAGVTNAMPVHQYFTGTAAVQPPLHGMELAARVTAIDTLPYQHFQPNNYYAHGWSPAYHHLPPPPPPPQAPRYAAVQPHFDLSDSSYPLPPPPPPPPEDAHTLQRPMVAMVPTNGSYGATSWARPVLPPSDWPGSWALPVQQPGGQTSWAPQAQQPVGQASSWAWAPPAQQQRPGMPAASPANGSSAQAQPPRVTTDKKTFEEFLLDAGVLDEQTIDKIFVDEVSEEMLGDEQRDRDDHWVSFGDVLLALGAVSGSPSGAGPSTHQVRVPAQEAALGAGTSTTGGGPGGGRDQEEAAAAAEAREWRRRRMAKRKEAAVRHHRPDKHAAPRGSQNGPGAI